MRFQYKQIFYFCFLLITVFIVFNKIIKKRNREYIKAEQKIRSKKYLTIFHYFKDEFNETKEKNEGNFIPLDNPRNF